MQTDPIGVNGGINMYAYTGNDPVNATDPLGLVVTAFYESGSYTCDWGGTDGATWVCIWYPAIVVVGTRGCGAVSCSSYTGGTPGGARVPPTGPATSGGRTGGAVQTGKPPKPACGSPDDGPVDFKMGSLTTVPFMGLSVAKGTFTTAGGASGTFESSGFGFGFEAGISVTRGSAPNLGTFTSFSDNINVSIGPFAFSGSRSESNGNLYGSGGGGYGLSPVGASLTSTYTNITSITCPGSR